MLWVANGSTLKSCVGVSAMNKWASVSRLLAMFLFVAVSAVSLKGELPHKPLAVSEIIKFGNEFFSSNRNKPCRVVIKNVKNRIDPTQVDTWHTCHSVGYWFKYYRSSTAPDDLLSVLVIDSKEAKLPLGIMVGMPKGKVLESLGAPFSESRNAISYTMGDVISNSVTFEFKGGTLRKVRWDYEID